MFLISIAFDLEIAFEDEVTHKYIRCIFALLFELFERKVFCSNLKDWAKRRKKAP